MTLSPTVETLADGLRRIKRAGLAMCFVVTSLVFACGPSTAQPLQPEEVAPGVWMVQGVSALGSSANRNFISNAAFVVTPAGVVVIDALGSPPLAEELIAAIRRITPQPVKHVVVTHYHADHVYGLQAFQDLGATITAHSSGQAYLHSDTAKLRLQASR